MSKVTGLGWTALNVDTSAGSPTDIRNDVTNFTFATPKAVQDVTGIDKYAIERRLLLTDFTIELSGVFNPDLSHTVLRTVPSTAVARTTDIMVSSQVLSGELLYTDYALTRAASGELTWTAPGVLADGTLPTWTTV